MPVDANLNLSSDIAATQGRQLEENSNRAALPVNFQQLSADPNVDRKPDYWLHIFNIGPIKHSVQRPPLTPFLTILDCPPEKPYLLSTSIPNIVNHRYVDAVTGNILTQGFHGELVANGIVNPSNFSRAQFSDVVDWANSGNDLTSQGCFWSRHNPPLASEIATARSRMERYFQQQVELGNQLHESGKTSEITPRMHVAASYFKLQLPWHRRYEVPTTCPECGEEIKPGVSFHRNSLSLICVLDWRRAVEAGVKALADVPESKRWKGPNWGRAAV